MSPDNIHTVHSICASAQSLFAFLIVCKSVEASGDYYTEEGGGRGWELQDLLVVSSVV